MSIAAKVMASLVLTGFLGMVSVNFGLLGTLPLLSWVVAWNINIVPNRAQLFLDSTPFSPA